MRVAVVNDLALAREALRRLVLSTPGNTVAWVANDGEEAVQMAAVDRPDAILMDLVMPNLDGVEATRRIMKQSPCPVIVVTATIPGNYDLVMRAMGAGALDAVETPALAADGRVQRGERLVARLRQLADAVKGVRAPFVTAGRREETHHRGQAPRLVLLGASTGGPDALAAVIGAFPERFPAAVVVAQHIAAEFSPGLVLQLARKSLLPVRLAADGEPPACGTVLVAGTNDHLGFAPDRTLRYTPHPRTSPWRPSVDVLFASAALHWPAAGVAALLTGMGTDGGEGLLSLRTVGWHTIAQDEPTCVVYGMPKFAADRKAAIEVLPLSQIGPSIAAKVLAREVG